MIKHLSIRNYILIESSEVDFQEGFSVITGETGAGKSIILGALSLVLGRRADSNVLYDKSKKAVVEAVFDIKEKKLQSFFDNNDLDYDDITIIRREINAQGRSRSFINDTPVTLNVLKELSFNLVDIHSQHSTLLINRPEFQLSVIDTYAANTVLLSEYSQRYKEYVEIEKSLQLLVEEQEKGNKEKDYLQFVFDEIETAQLHPGQQQEMEKKIAVLNNAEEIKATLFNSVAVLRDDEDAVLSRINEISTILGKISSFYPEVNELTKRINSCAIELEDVILELNNREQEVEYDPEMVESINDRLSLIYKLHQKHNTKHEEELLKVKSEIQEKILSYSNLEERISALLVDKNKRFEVLNKQSQVLSQNRQKYFTKLEDSIKKLIARLGMPNAEFKISHIETEKLTSTGIDKISFLFNANKGGEIGELSKIASGGEMSRVMLAIKYIVSKKIDFPVIVFDEIDSGVSGEIAAKLGEMLSEMAQDMQLIAISHLPQIAVKASSHFVVYKEDKGENTKSYIKKLTSKDRIDEVSKMLSGSKRSGASIETAREMLEM